MSYKPPYEIKWEDEPMKKEDGCVSINVFGCDKKFKEEPKKTYEECSCKVDDKKTYGKAESYDAYEDWLPCCEEHEKKCFEKKCFFVPCKCPEKEKKEEPECKSKPGCVTINIFCDDKKR